jgi:K+-transporting ATPase ATPase C chain
MLVLCSVLLGGIYPAFCSLMMFNMFRAQSEGSLIVKDGVVVGSELIGQNFTGPGYFWGRLSATTPAYNAAASSGSNLGTSNPALMTAVKTRTDALGNSSPIPVDLATASGSGLDPQISPAAAQYQIKRVANARGISEASLRRMVEKYTQHRQLGFLGEPRVNVLKLNLALDGKF